MVRKVVILFITLTVISALPITVSALDVEITSDIIPQEIINTFQGILLKELNIFDDYIFFKGNDNNYYLIIGDLEKNNDTIISSESVKVYVYYPNDNNNFTNYDIDSISLNTTSKIFYSNIKGYPDIIDRSIYNEITIIIVLFIIIIVSAARYIFSTNTRLHR